MTETEKRERLPEIPHLAGEPKQRGKWHKVTRWIGPAVAVALLILAALVLREITHKITFRDIRRAVGEVPFQQIGFSLLLASLAAVTMGMYDVLSARIARLRRVHWQLAAVAGFCGYALSNAIGFHIILGGTVRYRIYSRAGIRSEAIAQILALSLSTIWLSVTALMAIVFILEPGSVPLFRWAPATTQVVGVGLGLGLIGLIVWLWPGRSGLKLFGWRFPVPNGPGAVVQTVLGVADFGLAAAALYVLLPPDLRPEFPAFALIFTTAFLAGALSHAPGGLGVLEAGILLGLGAANRPDAIAALIVFRLTYYILPLIGAIWLLVGMEIFGHGRPWRTFWRYSALAGAAGLVMVLLLILTRKG